MDRIDQIKAVTLPAGPVTCIYHNADLDGHCSGAAIALRYRGARMVGMNYGQILPELLWRKGEQLVMIDFSLPMDSMFALCEQLASVGGHMWWVDHHTTAKDQWEQCPSHPPNITTILNMEYAACELVGFLMGRDAQWSEVATLLGIYDTWRFNPRNHDDVFNYQYGLRSLDTNPDTESSLKVWENIFAADVNSVKADGLKLRNYVAQAMAHTAKIGAFTTILKTYGLDDLRCVVMVGIIAFANSTSFVTVFDPEKHDAMLYLVWVGDKWRCSLYSPPGGRDVSAYAVARGGGGHAHACGFTASLTFLTEIIGYGQ